MDLVHKHTPVAHKWPLGRALDDALNSAVFGAQQALGGQSLGASDESSFSEICCKQKAAKNNESRLNI
jgi:hypothetical protein